MYNQKLLNTFQLDFNIPKASFAIRAKREWGLFSVCRRVLIFGDNKILRKYTEPD
jgi:hypothetical protein